MRNLNQNPTIPDEEFMILENEDEIGPVDDEDNGEIVMSDIQNMNIIDNL